MNMSDDEAEKIEITGEDIGNMMSRVEPFLVRMMYSFSTEDHTLALMATAAWGVFHLGAQHGNEAAKEYCETMARQAYEISSLIEEDEEEEDRRYDA